jgi:Nod factor-specific ABC transporter NodJ protein
LNASKLRFLHVVGRNFLVWRKLMYASMLGNMADPMIYLVGLGFGLGAFMPTIGGMRYISFLAGGMLCYSAMNSATFEALYSAFSRLKVQRTWEGIMHAPMTAADVVIGEWIWAALKATLSGRHADRDVPARAGARLPAADGHAGGAADRAGLLRPRSDHDCAGEVL